MTSVMILSKELKRESKQQKNITLAISVLEVFNTLHHDLEKELRLWLTNAIIASRDIESACHVIEDRHILGEEDDLRDQLSNMISTCGSVQQVMASKV